MSNSVFTGHGSLEESKNALVKDLKSVVNDADQLLTQVVNSTAEEYAAARNKIETKMHDARARLHDARIAAADKACHAADLTQKYVSENPWKVVGIIAAVGAIIGILNSRR
ncbi:MAG TPA: DUF883 family protein [Azonexus sp.]|nr:DUF883 family protein [Azonexus sp.]